jgi:hypothetical protein
MFVINLGGEGEIPGVLNQQRPFALSSNWLSVSQQTIARLVAAGHTFLICPNDAIALPDGCVDEVVTNSVPVDTTHPFYGPGVQTSEVKRILKPGGRRVRDGVIFLTKP